MKSKEVLKKYIKETDLGHLIEFVKKLRGYLDNNCAEEFGLKEFESLHLHELTGVSQVIFSRLKTGKNISKSKNKEVESIEKILKRFKIKTIFDESMNYKFIPTTAKDNEYLEELATKLACNIVDVSTSFRERNEPHQDIIKTNLLEKYRVSEDRERIILITGAGVSHSATKGVIPLSKDAIEKIKKEVISNPSLKKEGIPQRIIKNELDYIGLSTNLKKDEFETQLLAYSKFDLEGVKKGLREMCKPKYIPNLEYEILAHLIKRRAIDVIFDFNIDELFNVKLEEEIARGDFENIISDRHCPDNYNDLLIGKRLKQPVYIKPHGTISHSNSLSFTRENLSKIPAKIRELITDILTAELPDTVSSEQRFLKINFIIIGFGMKSPLLMESIKKYLDLEIRVERGIDPHFWFFDKKKELPEFGLALEEKHQKIFDENHTIFTIDENESLADYLKALWGFVENSFSNNDKYKIKGIERHLLVNEIFDLTEDEIRHLQKENPEFWHDRALVELFINIICSNGLLLSKRILESRTGDYLKRLNELESPIHRTSLRKMCNKLGLTSYKDFITNAFVLNPPKQFYDKKLVSILYDLLAKEILSKKIKNGLSHENKREKIIDIAMTLKERNSLNIKPQFINLHRDIFPLLKEENVLSTSLAWRYQYRQVLDKNNWDLMLAVSEKGRILPKTRSEIEKMFRGKKLELILSSFNIQDDFADVDPSRENIRMIENSNILLSNNPLFLPWWVHNQHMVIFLKRKKDHHNFNKHRNKWDILNSFYYESRMLATSVKPVIITELEDKNELLNIYANYWYRAKKYTKQNNYDKDKPRTIPIIPNKDFLDKQVENLLKLYSKNL